MSTSFACVLFQERHVSREALALGFAIATAGFDVPRASLIVGEPSGLPGWRVAFYRSGGKLPAYEELDHVADLFDEELTPGAMVWEAGNVETGQSGVVYSLVYSDDGVVQDDAIRFAEDGVRRCGVREGDAGLEAVHVDGEQVTVTPLGIQADAEPRALETKTQAHRGTSFVSSELRAAILPALVGALFTADEVVKLMLVDPGASSIDKETRRLVSTLRRSAGRCESTQPWVESSAALTIPATLRAFWDAYDWHDPSDPSDLYRELALGRIVGTLHFARPWQLASLAEDARWKGLAVPFATLTPGALGGSTKQGGVLALAPDGETLWLAPPGEGELRPAGPTLGELIRYLALGFKSSRVQLEDDVLDALMLRAHVRSSA